MKGVENFTQMIKYLQYMEKFLPDLLKELETIQQRVDERHKRSDKTTVHSCTTSIIGGIMILGGIIFSPLTFGLSVGLTVAGTAVVTCGSVVNAASKIDNLLKDISDRKASDEMVKKFYNRYEAAKKAYEEVDRVYQELKAMMPTVEDEHANAHKAILNAFEHLIDCGSSSDQMPTKAIKPASTLIACGGQTSSAIFKTGHVIHKAIASPRALCADMRLATAPCKAIPLTKRLFAEAASTMKFAITRNGNEFKAALTASVRTVGTITKTVGVITTAAGILYDAFVLGLTIRKLYKGTKCNLSQDISKHIKDLEKLGHGLKQLNQQITANINSVTNQQIAAEDVKTITDQQVARNVKPING